MAEAPWIEVSLRPPSVAFASRPSAPAAAAQGADLIRPSNRFLVWQRDRRWPRVLSAVLLVASVVFVALFLVGWPRLQCTSLYYDLVRLRTEVDELELRHRTLSLELESERSPSRLASQASALGLEPPPAPTAGDPNQAQVQQ